MAATHPVRMAALMRQRVIHVFTRSAADGNRHYHEPWQCRGDCARTRPWARWRPVRHSDAVRAGSMKLQRARRVAPKDDSQVTEQQGERSADINEHEFHSRRSSRFSWQQSSNRRPRGQPSEEVRHLRIQGDGTKIFGGIAKSETPPPRGRLPAHRLPDQVPAGADFPATQIRSRPSCLAR